MSKFSHFPNWAAACLLGLGSFLAYAATLPASLSTGDSAELAIAVHSLGLAHPTGFPAYLLLAKLWSWLLPLGNLAWELNLFSAAAAAATVGVVFLIAKKLELSSISSITGSLLLAAGYRFWFLTGSTHAYHLSLLLLALTLWLLLAWQRQPRQTTLWLLAVTLSLGLGTHFLFVVITPVVVILLLTQKTALLQTKNLLPLGLLAVVTLGLYAYIPLRAWVNPVLGWNHPTQLTEVIDYIRQKDYAYKIGLQALPAIWTRLGATGQALARESLGSTLLLGLIGLSVAWKRNRPLVWAIISLIIANLGLVVLYGNTQDSIILYRYLLPTFLCLSLLTAYVLELVRPRLRPAVWVMLLLPIGILAANAGDNTMPRTELIQNFAENILGSIPDQAVLVSAGDLVTVPIWYLQEVEGRGNDKIVVDANLLPVTWYARDIARRYPELAGTDLAEIDYRERVNVFLERAAKTRDVYMIGNFITPDGFMTVPHGLVRRLLPKAAEINLDTIILTNTQSWQRFNLNIPEKNWQIIDPLQAELIHVYGVTLVNLGVFYAEHERNDLAAEAFEHSLKFQPDNQNVRQNLIDYYTATGQPEQAAKIQ